MGATEVMRNLLKSVCRSDGGGGCRGESGEVVSLGTGRRGEHLQRWWSLGATHGERRGGRVVWSLRFVGDGTDAVWGNCSDSTGDVISWPLHIEWQLRSQCCKQKGLQGLDIHVFTGMQQAQKATKGQTLLQPLCRLSAGTFVFQAPMTVCTGYFEFWRCKWHEGISCSLLVVP